jgi:hypothetical protein
MSGYLISVWFRDFDDRLTTQHEPYLLKHKLKFAVQVVVRHNFEMSCVQRVKIRQLILCKLFRQITHFELRNTA